MKTIRLISIIILGSVCLAARAQDGSENALGKYVTLSVNREDGRYAKGEKVRVCATLSDSGFGELRMICCMTEY